MSQRLMSPNVLGGSLPAPGAARRLLLEMARDTERAERICEHKRQLKAADPKWTWRYIAEQLGVSLRSVNEWPKTGGISEPNARKLADLWDVTYEWVYYGDQVGTPNLLGALSQLDRIEQAIKSTADEPDDELLAHIARLEDIAKGHAGEDQVEKVRAEFRGEVGDMQGRLTKIEDGLADAVEGLRKQYLILSDILAAIGKPENLQVLVENSRQGLEELARGEEEALAALVEARDAKDRKDQAG